MTAPTRPAKATALLALALLAAGCSSGGGSTPARSPSAPTASASASASAPSGARGIPTTGEVEVTRVEGDCVYVGAEGSPAPLSLRGEVPEVAVGDRLRLTGAPDDTADPACPDGRPFLVTTVTPVG